MNKPSLINLKSGSYLVSPGEMISSHMYLKGVWEQEVIEISKYLLNGCMDPVVLDIGANLGSYAVPIASFIEKSNGRVYAFEPQRKIYNQLCGNIFVNDLDNLFAYNCALGNKVSTTEIKLPDYKKFWNPGALSLDSKSMIDRGLDSVLTNATESVSVFTLNSLQLTGTVLLIKLDVEGMEYDVLKGGDKFLKQHFYPTVILEVWKNEKDCSFNPSLLYLRNFGYDIYQITETEFIAQHPLSSLKRKYESK